MGMALPVLVGREREAAAVASSLGRATRHSRVTPAGGGQASARRVWRPRQEIPIRPSGRSPDRTAIADESHVTNGGMSCQPYRQIPMKLCPTALPCHSRRMLPRPSHSRAGRPGPCRPGPRHPRSGHHPGRTVRRGHVRRGESGGLDGRGGTGNQPAPAGEPFASTRLRSGAGSGRPARPRRAGRRCQRRGGAGAAAGAGAPAGAGDPAAAGAVPRRGPALSPDWDAQVRNLYRGLLDCLDITVTVDVLAGTSAGGVNAALLGLSSAAGADLARAA